MALGQAIFRGIEQLFGLFGRERNRQGPILVAVRASGFVLGIGQIKLHAGQTDIGQVFFDQSLQRQAPSRQRLSPFRIRCPNSVLYSVDFLEYRLHVSWTSGGEYLVWLGRIGPRWR